MLGFALRRSQRHRSRDGTAEAVRVVIAGTLDASAAPLLDEALGAAAATARVVLVDLRGLWRADLAGAGLIAQAEARIRARGGRLLVVVKRPEVEAIFTSLGLDTAPELRHRALPPLTGGERRGEAVILPRP